MVDTISFMKRAGIKVWLLTGDKTGTAVNIGKAAGLLDSEKYMEIHEFMNEDESKIAAQLTHKFCDKHTSGMK